MKAIQLLRTSFFCASALTATAVLPQSQPGQLFIEPCVWFTYDTAAFRIGERLSNTFYHTEGYEIFHSGRPGGRFIIEAMRSNMRSPQAERDSLIALAIAEGNKLDNEVVAVHRPGIPVHHKGFFGVGMVVRAKDGSGYGISFMGNIEYDGCACNITYSREDPESINDHEADLAVLKLVIDGIHGHSNAELAKRDSALVPSVSVTVKPVARPADLPSFIKATYFGAVTVTGARNLRIKEASIPFGRFGDDAQLFTPNASGELIIYCNDATKGLIEKDCVLIMVDELERDVRIPFKLSYENP
jgi:hypothetical protein